MSNKKFFSKQTVDITGKVYDKLTVIGLSEKKKRREILWKCKHENGTIIKKRRNARISNT